MDVVEISPSTRPDLFTVDGVNRYSYAFDQPYKKAEVIWPCEDGMQKMSFGSGGVKLEKALWETTIVEPDRNIHGPKTSKVKTLGAYDKILDNIVPVLQYWNTDTSTWDNVTLYTGFDIAVVQDADKKLTVTMSMPKTVKGFDTTLTVTAELSQDANKPMKFTFLNPSIGGIKRRMMLSIPFDKDSDDLIDEDTTDVGVKKIKKVKFDFTDFIGTKHLKITKNLKKMEVILLEEGTLGDLDIDPSMQVVEAATTVTVQNFQGTKFIDYLNTEKYPNDRPVISKWNENAFGLGQVSSTSTAPKFGSGALWNDGTLDGDNQATSGNVKAVGISQGNVRFWARIENSTFASGRYIALFWTTDAVDGGFYAVDNNRVYVDITYNLGDPMVRFTLKDKDTNWVRKTFTIAAADWAAFSNTWHYFEIDWNEARADKLLAWCDGVERTTATSSGVYGTRDTTNSLYWAVLGITATPFPAALCDLCISDITQRNAGDYVAPVVQQVDTLAGITYLRRFTEYTTRNQFYLKFDTALGAGITEWKTSQANPDTLLSASTNLAHTMMFWKRYTDGATVYADYNDATAKLLVMENSPSRVRVRAKADMKTSAGASDSGKDAWTEYTIYSDGRMYIKSGVVNDANAIVAKQIELASQHAIANLAGAAEDGIVNGTNKFFTGVRAAGLLQDFAWVIHATSTFNADSVTEVGGTNTQFIWKDTAWGLGASLSQFWYQLFDMDAYTAEADADVISADYRSPIAVKKDTGTAETNNFGDDNADGFIEAQGAYAIKCGDYSGVGSNRASFIIDGATRKSHGPTVLLHEFFPKKNGAENDKSYVSFFSRNRDAGSISAPQVGDATGSENAVDAYSQHLRGNGSELTSDGARARWNEKVGTYENIHKEKFTVEFQSKNLGGNSGSASDKKNMWHASTTSVSSWYCRVLYLQDNSWIPILGSSVYEGSEQKYTQYATPTYLTNDFMLWQFSWDYLQSVLWNLWYNGTWKTPSSADAGPHSTDSPATVGRSVGLGTLAADGSEPDFSFGDYVLWKDALTLWPGRPMIASVPVNLPKVYIDGVEKVLGTDYELSYVGCGSWVLKFMADYTTKVAVEVADVAAGAVAIPAKARNASKLMRHGKFMSAGRSVRPAFAV